MRYVRSLRPSATCSRLHWKSRLQTLWVTDLSILTAQSNCHGLSTAVNLQIKRYGLTCLMIVCLTQSIAVQSIATVTSCTSRKHISVQPAKAVDRYGNRRRMEHDMLDQINALLAMLQDSLLVITVAALL